MILIIEPTDETARKIFADVCCYRLYCFEVKADLGSRDACAASSRWYEAISCYWWETMALRDWRCSFFCWREEGPSEIGLIRQFVETSLVVLRIDLIGDYRLVINLLSTLLVLSASSLLLLSASCLLLICSSQLYFFLRVSHEHSLLLLLRSPLLSLLFRTLILLSYFWILAFWPTTSSILFFNCSISFFKLPSFLSFSSFLSI